MHFQILSVPPSRTYTRGNQTLYYVNNEEIDPLGAQDNEVPSSFSKSLQLSNQPSALVADSRQQGHLLLAPIEEQASNNDTAQNNGEEGEATNAIRRTAANSTESVPLLPCPWKCELTNDRGYVLYSALGSFYIPMFVMLFFYWRIYRAAVRTTRAINQGFKTTKGRYHHNQIIAVCALAPHHNLFNPFKSCTCVVVVVE